MNAFKIYWDRLYNGDIAVATCDNISTAQTFCLGISCDTKSNTRIEGGGRVIKFISTVDGRGKHVVMCEEL